MITDGVAVITGAASGVGRATAELLLGRGAHVIGIDVGRPPQDQRPENIPITGDVAADDTWRAAIAVADDLGGASMLVLNAAHLITGTVLDGSEADIRSVFEVNVLGPVKGLRAVLPGMIKRGRGTVVAVASTDALYAEQGLAAYCTSKGALLQLIRCVAVDHARDGIRANVVCPGAIDTPFFRRHVDSAADSSAFLAAKTERHPSGRLLDPVDVAEVVCFLLSGRSIGVNGAPVVVDGGLTATFDFRAGP